MFRGYPDWQNPQLVAGHQLFAAYETPGTFMCAPSSLPVAEDTSKVPEFHLDLYNQDLGASGLSSFGLLTIRFRLGYDLAAAREALLSHTPDLQVMPLEVEDGWVRFTGTDAFNWPETLRIPRALDALGTNLTLHLRLNGTDADLFLETLRRGLSSLFADVLLIQQGVASRVANVVTFSPSTLQKALWRDNVTIPVAALSDTMTSGINSLPVHFARPVTDDEAGTTAQALLDRLSAHLGKLELSPDETGPVPYLRATSVGMPNSEMRFDLAEPVLVPRGFLVSADPLGTARTFSITDLENRLVQRIAAPAFHSGWRQINVAGNFPRHRIGAQLLGVEITAPPYLPARPHTVKTTVVFTAETTQKTVELKLSPDEPLRFTWHTLAIVNGGETSQTLEGPPQTYEGSGDATFLVVPPGAFEAKLVILEADPSLLAEAEIEVHVRGRRETQSWAGKGLLNAQSQELAVFLPRDVTQPELLATAISRANGTRVETGILPLVPTRFDPFSFPGTGVRRVSLKAFFTTGIREMLIECAPQDRLEDPLRRHLVRLTPAVPAAEFSYIALSPFHTGYCWRWASSGNTSGGSWSAPLNPDSPLVLSLSPLEDPMPSASSLILDGVELTSVPNEPRAYFYRPIAAGIANDATGRKQISLIEAGTVTMLSLTAQWGVEGSTLETVREKLATQLKLADTNAVTLRSALVEVGEVELWLTDTSGNLKPFLKATSSGMPPYATAFNTMLTAEQAPIIKKALKGERGLLRLRYTVTDRTVKHLTQSVTEQKMHTTETWTTTSAGTVGETTTHEETRADTQTSETTTMPQPPVTRLYEADAADWGLPT